jgi:hypothetical protein
MAKRRIVVSCLVLADDVLFGCMGRRRIHLLLRVVTRSGRLRFEVTCHVILYVPMAHSSRIAGFTKTTTHRVYKIEAYGSAQDARLTDVEVTLTRYCK